MRTRVKIELDNQKCVGCKACVDICPMSIFVKKENVELVNPDTCISCGHCVAICPKDAISHARFGEGKVHKVENSSVASGDLLNLIRMRRSNRSMTTKPIPQESLDMIIEAAFRAPTASNMQGLRFVLVKDPEKLSGVIDLTLSYFGEMLRKIDSPILRPLVFKFNPTIAKYFKAFQRMIDERKNGGDPILRKATALLIIYTDDSVKFGVQDSNLAYQNASLMAESLGVAQVYTGFVCMAASSDKKRRINNLLGIKKGTIHAGMALGMPRHKFGKYIDKRPINLTVI